MVISSMGKVGCCFSVVVLIIYCKRVFYCSAMASGLFRGRRSDLILNLNAINVLCHVSHLQHTAIHGLVCVHHCMQMCKYCTWVSTPFAALPACLGLPAMPSLSRR